MATKRGYIRQELKRANNNLDKVLLHFGNLKPLFDDEYPKVSESIVLLGVTVANLQQVLEEMYNSI